MAASNYRQWYCHEKRAKNQNKKDTSMSEGKPVADELSSNNDIEPSTEPTKGVFNRYSTRDVHNFIFIFRSPIIR